MNNFQTILTAIFLAFFVFAVLIFSGVIKVGSTKTKSGLQGNVVIWGTFPTSITLTEMLSVMNSSNEGLNVTYQKKDPITYQQDLIEAFAEGTGPDLFIITGDMIKRNNNFIYKVPYESYPEKVFRDSFIDGAGIYLDNVGVLGFPLIVDPMVLYYNKDILKNEGIVYPPKTWDELFTLNPVLTKRDDSGVISQSMIALGQYDNINNAKDILVTLLVQNGNSIIKKDTNQGYISTLNDNTLNLSISPIEAIMTFFIEFSNPSNTNYSWNRALPNSLDMFTAGKLVFYIGKASELFKIESINPNLSFDVTDIPQVKDSATKRTYGEIYSVVVSKKSINMASAIGVAGIMSVGDNAKNLSAATSLPPASKALLAKRPNDPYLFTFFNSALISNSWFDPDKAKTDLIFQELVENRLSGSLSMSEAIRKANDQLGLLLKK